MGHGKYYKSGDTLDWTNNTGAAVESKDVVVAGLEGVGIAMTDIAAGAEGSVVCQGVWQLPKYATAHAIAQNAPVWWDASEEKCYNAPAAGRYFAGRAFIAATATAAVVYVTLAPFAKEPGGRTQTAAAAANTTILAADCLSGRELTVLVPNTDAVSIILPSVADVPLGAVIRVRKTTADAEIVTLDGAGSEQVGGAATNTSIDANADTILIKSNGTSWDIIDSAIA